MQIKNVYWKKLPVLLAASAGLMLAGCSSPEAAAPYRQQRSVLTAAQRNESNNYPDSSKPDPVAAIYSGYSPQTLHSTRVGNEAVDYTPAFNSSPQIYAAPVDHGYYYGGYAPWGYGTAYDRYGGYHRDYHW